ncbi:CHAT domain-containing protein [Roseofilum casamattae]|uniref:CHAT domain-containing protein n=1 Tax=Roseofilum casamattae BLCC-M143 TaxID=3022442 RepID=A0ABT7BX42_9CYAN|nr:CHAT domain-containing protein [Roseofilum casamattae]MDJ1183736.1 CHAT domain-containing protein [Roseofilum casamattae BLCC-M143]
MLGDRPLTSRLFPHLGKRKLTTLVSLVLFSAVISIILLTQTSAWGLDGQNKSSQPNIRSLIRRVSRIEQTWGKQYATYFDHQRGDRQPTKLRAPEISAFLAQKGQETGEQSALVYIHNMPKDLEIVLVTPTGNIYRHLNRDVGEAKLQETAREFRNNLTHPRYLRTTRYEPAARQLYDWIIAPIEEELETEGIDSLLLCVGSGLRSVPLAALFDGDRFLVEKYSLTMIPAFNLMTSEGKKPRQRKVLAMGASEFSQLSPLPAVPLELELLGTSGSNPNRPWDSQAFLNEEFTLNNLQTKLQQENFDIVHLATHAAFNPGKPDRSYIQLWDTQLTLDRIAQLPFDNPPLDLLVLSACSTAVGDRQAELGFAGLAFESGVESVLASFWQVSDAGTLALMNEFYQFLPTSATKAQALQQAQIALLREQVELTDRQLRSSRGAVELPPTLGDLTASNLAAPFYWAAFTLIGSPW